MLAGKVRLVPLPEELSEINDSSSWLGVWLCLHDRSSRTELVVSLIRFLLRRGTKQERIG